MINTKPTSNNFKVVAGDTDGVSFCKTDSSNFTKEECDNLLHKLNDRMGKMIEWENDGVFSRMIVLRAKNYILYDGKTVKYKGSAIKATAKEPALKQFIKDLLNEMLEGSFDFVTIYNKIKDITRWATKKTITSKVLGSDRTNEKVVRDAIKDTEYVEGDKAYFYYKANGDLQLAEKFDGDYNKDKLLEKLYNTTSTFDTVIDRKTFLNYKLKRSKEALQQLLTSKSE